MRILGLFFLALFLLGACSAPVETPQSVNEESEPVKTLQTASDDSEPLVTVYSPPT